MSRIKGPIVVLLTAIAFSALTACGGSDDTSSESGAPAATEVPEATHPAAAATATDTAEQLNPTALATEPTEEPESEVPFDIPIMEGATDLFIQKEVGSVTYVLEDMEIDKVVEFYEAALTDQGWESKTSSTIGMMATLVYETEQARVSVSLQANTIAKTVNVRLFIHEE